MLLVDAITCSKLKKKTKQKKMKEKSHFNRFCCNIVGYYGGDHYNLKKKQTNKNVVVE